MAAEHKEVAIHLLHVDLEMGCALRPIYYDGNGIFVGNANDFIHRIDGAQHITYLRNADDFGVLVDHVSQRLHVHSAVIVHRYHAQHDAFSCGLQLPRHDIRMVFYGRNNHLVARFHHRFGKARRNKVEPFGGSAREDNLVCAAGVDETAHRFACLFVQIGGLLAQPMHPTMHVCVDIEVLFAHRIKHN